jgi:hypothetical protein
MSADGDTMESVAEAFMQFLMTSDGVVPVEDE